MKGHFGRMMGLLFCWHLFQYMVIPIITPYVVNQLSLSDQFIGMANALFNSLTFIGSLFLNKATIRFGNKTLTGGSIMLLAFYPILISTGPAGYVIGSIVGGTAWAITGGALYNYILENIPGNDRPAHMAWYTLVSNGAILIGSMVGPAIAAVIGFPTALVLFGIGRFLSGAAIKRWG
jgi:predicted MFS family arabinose efflux permease